MNVQYLIPIFSPRTVPSSCTQFAFLRFSNTRRMEYGNKKPRTRANLCIKRRVGKSLFCFSLFCSKSLSLNSDCERFALVTLYKRVTRVNHSLPWANCYHCSLQKSDKCESPFYKEWFTNCTFARKKKNKRFTRKTKERIPNPDKKNSISLWFQNY